MSRISCAATSLFACLATVAFAAPGHARHSHQIVTYDGDARSVTQQASGQFYVGRQPRYSPYKQTRERTVRIRRPRVAAYGSAGSGMASWLQPDAGGLMQTRTYPQSRVRYRRVGRAYATAGRYAGVSGDASGAVMGGRPAGCPRTYCGCGVSLKVFGTIRPELNLAWNWARYFQREGAPRAGLVAVRRGHVMQIVGGGDGGWVVYDPNSGGGLTRTHVHNLRGYIFVNPQAGRVATHQRLSRVFTAGRRNPAA